MEIGKSDMASNEDKRLAFDTAFDKGRVMVVINITDPKVDLPDIARDRSPDGRHLPLNYSALFIGANIKTNDDGIYADLAFGGPNQRHKTFVPWSAIRALIQRGTVLETWPESFHTQDDTNTYDLILPADELKWLTRNAAEA